MRQPHSLRLLDEEHGADGPSLIDVAMESPIPIP